MFSKKKDDNNDINFPYLLSRASSRTNFIPAKTQNAPTTPPIQINLILMDTALKSSTSAPPESKKTIYKNKIEMEINESEKYNEFLKMNTENS